MKPPLQKERGRLAREMERLKFAGVPPALLSATGFCVSFMKGCSACLRWLKALAPATVFMAGMTARSEITLPVAVDRHAGRQWVLGVHQPTGQP